MITDKRAEQAVEYIRDNAARIGELAGSRSFHHQKIKTVMAGVFLETAGAVELRKQTAIASSAYYQACGEEREVIQEHETERLKLKAAEYTIEVWRTQQANNRKGHF